MTATPALSSTGLREVSPRVKVIAGALIIVALLAPCWWQPRIMAGDLSSHIYNAWLVTLVRQGQAPGLELRPVFTNIAFDTALEKLLNSFGPALAQRIAVSAVVLIFAVGALWFISAVSRRTPWFLVPSLLMVSYGWTFHMGFFNFLISTGCSLAAFGAVIPSRSPVRIGIAVGVSALAVVAHPFPVLCLGGLAAYWFAAHRVRPRWRAILFCVASAAILAAREVLMRNYGGVWSPQQYISAIGAGQLWVFGAKSFLFVPAAFAIWALLFWRLTWTVSLVRLLLQVRTQVVLLISLATFALPTCVSTTKQDTGFSFFSYISDRMSLLVIVCILALLARARAKLVDVWLASLLCLAFYATMYVEHRRLNGIEDKIDAAVRALPRGVRVTVPMFEFDRTNQTGHMIDRACVARCFSYANYEPTALGFRLKVVGNSPLVARTYAMSVALQTGEYRPLNGDWPFYKIEVRDNPTRLVTSFVGPSD